MSRIEPEMANAPARRLQRVKAGVATLHSDSLLCMRDWLDEITLGLAVFGAGLSVVNTWQARQQTETRLEISAGLAQVPGQPNCLGVELINHSAFPVTIREISLSARDGKTRFFFHPPYLDGTTLPFVIEPRAHRFCCISPLALQRRSLSRAKELMVTTGDGKVFKGASPILKKLIVRAMEEEKQQEP